MDQRSPDKNQLVISYLALRQAVGWIGTLLPVVLLAGNAISAATPRPDSISGYYYTDMRNVFVGVLCALGVFLAAYDGYDAVDRWLTNIAGFGAIGAALCPTKPAVCTAGACPRSSVTHLSASQQVVGDVHVVFAAVTFIVLGLMALRFAQGGKTLDNVVYRVCGATILACVILAAASNILPASVNAHWPLLFVFESVALFAFGVSWFVKGHTIQAIRARVRKGAPSARPVAAIPELEGHR